MLNEISNIKINHEKKIQLEIMFAKNNWTQNWWKDNKNNEDSGSHVCKARIKAVQLAVRWNYGVNVRRSGDNGYCHCAISASLACFSSFPDGWGFHPTARSLSDVKYRDISRPTGRMSRSCDHGGSLAGMKVLAGIEIALCRIRVNLSLRENSVPALRRWHIRTRFRKRFWIPCCTK